MTEEYPEEEPYEPRHAAPETTSSGLMSNKLYDMVKFLALIAFPALGTLYFALATIWGLPNPEEVVGTIVALDAFLGVLLGLSSSRYKDETEGVPVGELLVREGVDGKQMQLNFPGDPNKIEQHKKVAFKVRKIS